MNGKSNIRIVSCVLMPAIFVQAVIGETLYVEGMGGNDANPGTKQEPLRTIERAAIMVNSRTEGGPTTIKVAPGIYSLDETVAFKNGRPYTEKDRLIIEASILPDAPSWKPTLMPVILSIMDPRKPGKFDTRTETSSLKIEVSHVTIRGLKFFGNPLSNNGHICIERVGGYLDDLLVTQCIFVGNRDSLDINVAVIATGDRFVTDHSIFYNCHTTAIFWDGLEGIAGKGCAMRYCIVDGGYISGVWTCQTTEDFEFHHNIITRCEYSWIRKAGDRQKYQISDCIISDNRYYSGYGTEMGASSPAGPEISYYEKNVTKEGNVVLERDWKAREYLHVMKGFLGSDLGAGLFDK